MQELPANIVRLTRSNEGITLYFPPLRNPGAALMLALFGVSCFIPGLFAAIAMAPFASHGPGGMIAIWLMSIFILPFTAFGILFVVLAAYQVSNSLTVTVTGSEIRSRRRVFGLGFGERRVPTTDVARLDAVAVARYRFPRERAVHYNLVIRTGSHRVTVAESLRGEAVRDEVHTEIARAARLEHLAREE